MSVKLNPFTRGVTEVYDDYYTICRSSVGATIPEGVLPYLTVVERVVSLSLEDAEFVQHLAFNYEPVVSFADSSVEVVSDTAWRWLYADGNATTYVDIVLGAPQQVSDEDYTATLTYTLVGAPPQVVMNNTFATLTSDDTVYNIAVNVITSDVEVFLVPRAQEE